MPIKTGRRKQQVATGLGAPVDHDGLPPPHMMTNSMGPQVPQSVDNSPMVPGPGSIPHHPSTPGTPGTPMGLGAHPSSNVPPGGYFHGPGGPMGPNGPQGPGPGMMPGPGIPMHGPNGPHGPHGPMNPAFFRRHTPYFGQPDFRLYELNKRLQQRTEDSDNLWWDAFATEFFEDDATLTLTFCLEDGPKRYTIGRTLIPRYFRSIFDGGVTDLYYTLKHPRESFHNTSITLECECCTMVTHHGKPMYTKVCTDGKLILEFTFDDLMRIKSWHFAVRGHRELIPRTVIMQQDPSMVETLGKNITRQGLTTQTLNYLRLCVILEPMQELMSRHKAYALSPRDCLKTTLFQKWQRMIAPPETQRAPNKRRKRKGSQSGQNANSNSTGSGKKRSPGPNYNLASQVSDVMVVGEPSLMGGEFGDEDERLITRLENSQYDTPSVDEAGASAGGPNPGGPSNGPQGGAGGGAGGGGPPQSGQPGGGPGQVPTGAPGGPTGGGGPSGPTPFSNSPMTTGGPGGPWPEPPRQPQEGDKKSPAISQ